MPVTPPSEGRKSPGRGFFQSPHVRSRVQEKEELSDLNDRLATYIDRMRYLEQQNSKLSAEITTSKETVSREVASVKALFETELSEARRLLDDTAKEKALLQLENNKLSGLVEDLRHRLDKETSLRVRTEDELKRIERRLHEKESLLIVVTKERKDLDIKVKDLEKQLKDLQDELEEQKTQLEKEIIRRVDAENRAQTLQEEADFYKQVHNKEIAELKASSESFRISIDRTDGYDYDNVLRDKLQELRGEFEEEAENARQELEDAYKMKFEELRSSNDRERAYASRLLEKNTELKAELDNLASDYSVIESKIQQLTKRNSELEKLRALDKEDFKRQIQEREEKIQSLNDKLDELEKEYETLLGVKIALDIEIAAYRKLLEGEEERLNIPSPHVDRSSSRRGTKRGHVESETTVDNTASGSIEIAECDSEGRYVKLCNKSDNDEPLGGWILHKVVDGKDEDAIEYKFSNKYVLKAGQTVTVWGQSTGVKHKPPTDLVFKNFDWPTGLCVVTSVINSEAEIVAKHSLVTAVTEETNIRKVRRGRRAGAERESCAVM